MSISANPWKHSEKDSYTIPHFSFTVRRHLNEYGIPTQPPTIETSLDPDFPEGTILMYDKTKITIVKNIDTGERMLVFDYKPKGDKKTKGRTTKKGRQIKHR
jgi:hypothetical protein